MWKLGCLRLLVLAAVLAVGTAVPLPGKEAPKCGYESCPKPKPGVINVHLVPHSHDDVGWLKTVDQYYYGSNTRIQRAGVQYIIDSVVGELLKNPNRKFIQVETAFFAKWWKDQDEPTRQKVKSLVENGQLEFVGGAWSMNDEAAVNYQSTIDQFTWGYRFLNDTFGKCGHPRVAWQIDPFGHSRSFHTLLTQMRIDGTFFARIDFQDRANRKKSRNMEMIWKTSPNLGTKADLFTGVFKGHYNAPKGFCFDMLCKDDPIVDDPESPENNVDNRVNDFAKIVKEQAEIYSNNVLLTMGGDFHYQSAGKWYKNLDSLIKHVNANKKIGLNAFYSTPSCYLKALHETNKTWTTKEDDFFPYGSNVHSYWTGYFSSRPTHKFMERLGNNFLQVSKQLSSLATLTTKDDVNLSALRESMGVVQHHDAITGTEKEHVARDYARILSLGFKKSQDVVQNALRKLTSKTPLNAKETPATFVSCFALNTSECDQTAQKSRFVVTAYNPQAQKENIYVRVPVQEGSYNVLDSKGRQQDYQLVPIPEFVRRIPGRDQSLAQFELVFYAEQLPPLGFRSYYIEKTGDKPRPNYLAAPISKPTIGFANGPSVEVDDQTGLMKSVTSNGVRFNVKQNFMVYKSHTGNQKENDKRASGAYIFRPNGAEQRVKASKVSFRVYKGKLVEEIHQSFSDWVTQVIRTYANQSHVELVWQVGPIPVDDSTGKEIVSRFETELKTDGIFYTDSNGREMIRRKRDFRPTWNVNLQEKVSGNYYPITSRLSLRDPKKKQSVVVLVDRAQGGSSLKDGQLEFMVHRRILKDDGFGVGEALNETAFGKGLVARGTHILLAGQEVAGKPTLAAQERVFSRRLLAKPWIFVSSVAGNNGRDYSFKEWQDKFLMEFSGSELLPDNVHLLTLEPWKDNSLLLRLEHIFEKGEDSILSKPATVNLQALLKPLKIVSARETNLAGSAWIGESKRLSWKTAASNDIPQVDSVDSVTDAFTITLNPQEIRTFVVNVKK